MEAASIVFICCFKPHRLGDSVNICSVDHRSVAAVMVHVFKIETAK